MEEEFKKLARVWYLYQHSGRRAALRAAFLNLFGGIGNTNEASLSSLATKIGSTTKTGLIYSNTVANGRVLEALSALGCPILTHVHELELAICKYAGEDFELVKRYTDHFVAVSEAVRSNLISRHGIPGDKIECIHGFLPTTNNPNTETTALKRALAAEISIPEDIRIVGGCGTVDWGKGCDLFLQLAKAIQARRPESPVHLVWLGAKPYGDIYSRLEHDIDRAGLSNCVHFIGTRSNPLDYIAAFDVLALVSREDSFPLVMLEAALAGIPTICFDNAGGGREFVEEDAGCVVPYLDIGAMADCVLRLIGTDDLRIRLGKRAQEKVRERHDIGVSAPKILHVIERMLTR